MQIGIIHTLKYQISILFFAFIFLNSTVTLAEPVTGSGYTYFFESEYPHRGNATFYLVPKSEEKKYCEQFEVFSNNKPKTTLHALFDKALESLKKHDISYENLTTFFGLPKDAEVEFDELEFKYACDRESLDEDSCYETFSAALFKGIQFQNDYFTTTFDIKSVFKEGSEEVEMLYKDLTNKKGFKCDLIGNGSIVSKLSKPYIIITAGMEFSFTCNDLINPSYKDAPEITQQEVNAFIQFVSSSVLSALTDFSSQNHPDPLDDISSLLGAESKVLRCQSGEDL